jgi:phage shock protein PspC (stress-responsive transcriptional regulator)
MICGVCAEIAARAALPTWVPRVVFVIGGLTHAFFAIVLYVILSRVFCLGRRRWAPATPAPRYAAGPDLGTVRNRFGNLDERLSTLEAATLQRETALRRAFRDLERG